MVLRFKVACCSGQGSEAGLALPWPQTDDDMLMLCYGGFARSLCLVDEVPEIELGAVERWEGHWASSCVQICTGQVPEQSSRARHRYG